MLNRCMAACSQACFAWLFIVLAHARKSFTRVPMQFDDS
jgi:hypothetical protein